MHIYCSSTLYRPATRTVLQAPFAASVRVQGPVLCIHSQPNHISSRKRASSRCVHAARLLSTCLVFVVQVTAAEYTRLYLTALKDTLNMYPPPQPSTAAVNLLVTVGQQQEFLLWHSLLPPPGHPGSLDALAVFSPHVERWIHNSQDALCQRCHQLEGSTQALQGGATGEDGAPCSSIYCYDMLLNLPLTISCL